MKKIVLIAAIVVVALVVGGYKFAKPDFSGITGMFAKNKTLSEDEAKTKALDYINNNLVAPGTKVEVKTIAKKSGLYKLDLDVSGQSIEAYMTVDGLTFFPSAMDMNAETGKDVAGQEDAAPAQEVPKSDKPVVELFVMSYCPYGTQIEKGILPVVDALGNSIDFQLKFVDYAMHDKKELDENLRQYCIEKNEPAKLNAYLACFLKSEEPGQESACMSEAGVNTAQVASCMDATDKEYKVTESYNDKSTWNNGQFPPFNVEKADNEKYGVQGSPTLVINGVEAQSARDPQSLLKTICSAFNTEPEACSKELSSAAPSPGFGEGTASGSTDANCGN